MPCFDQYKIPESEIKAALARLEKYLETGNVGVEIGENGSIAFAGWTAEDRGKISDLCAYRRLMLTCSFPLRLAVQRAEARSGRKIDQRTVAAGTHSHDGGQTWNAGH